MDTRDKAYGNLLCLFQLAMPGVDQSGPAQFGPAPMSSRLDNGNLHRISYSIL